MRIVRRLRKHLKLRALLTLGVIGYMDYWLQRAFGRRIVRVKPRGSARRVWVRTGTSDEDVIGQVYSKGEIRPPVKPEGVRTILDAGANVGITAGYLLDQFPGARMIAVEPSPANIVMFRRNVEADRCELVQAGLWDRNEDLHILNPADAAWAFQLGHADHDGSASDAVPGLTLDDLAARAGVEHFDVLKIDIEGAETRVVTDRFRSHFERAKLVFIEPHGEEIERSVRAYLDGLGFRVTKQDDMLVGHRPV